MDRLTDSDRAHLCSAIRLATNGRGAVEPNPMVGCVIVKEGRVIGQGWHERFGGPHAEPNALRVCAEPPRGATAYVTLEPCCHTSKKTPPCVPALLNAGIARVVIGCTDPNPAVSGRGAGLLREGGIEVIEAEDSGCKQLIAPFIARIVHRRPYVTLKWAQSADNKVSGPAGRRVRISGERSHHVVHAVRSRSDAIMVGIGTVRADDCLLTARGAAAARPLLRCVLDSDLRLSPNSRLAQTTDQGRVIVFCSKEAADYSGTRVPLAALGVEICPVSSEAPGRLSLHAIAEFLGAQGCTHAVVEPGPTLAGGFFAGGPWDRAWVFRSDKKIGGDGAAAAPPPPPNPVSCARLDSDELTEYLNPHGVYFGNHPSADFVLCTNAPAAPR